MAESVPSCLLLRVPLSQAAATDALAGRRKEKLDSPVSLAPLKAKDSFVSMELRNLKVKGTRPFTCQRKRNLLLPDYHAVFCLENWQRC